MAVQTVTGSSTERSALDLARAIRTGETSSRDAVEARIERLELERALGGWVAPPSPDTAK